MCQNFKTNFIKQRISIIIIMEGQSLEAEELKTFLLEKTSIKCWPNFCCSSLPDLFINATVVQLCLQLFSNNNKNFNCYQITNTFLRQPLPNYPVLVTTCCCHTPFPVIFSHSLTHSLTPQVTLISLPTYLLFIPPPPPPRPQHTFPSYLTLFLLRNLLSHKNDQKSIFSHLLQQQQQQQQTALLTGRRRQLVLSALHSTERLPSAGNARQLS